MSGQLYVVTGLSHMTSSYGEIWVVDMSGSTPEAIRRIRLPSEARRLRVTDSKAVIFQTGTGDVALSETGQLLDLRSPEVCKK